MRRYIKDCLDKGIMTEDAERKTGLLLATVSEQWNMVNAGMLEEDELYWTHISPFLGELSGNVQDIWYYAFTEIMNNAIDHSGGDQIRFGIQKDALYTEISKMPCIRKFRLRIMVWGFFVTYRIISGRSQEYH